MTDFFDEVNKMVNDIIDHKINKSEVSAKIFELKETYGEDAFPSIHFQRKEQPWDRKYLQKLKEMNITGACSEEFLLHMAEVSDCISSKKKKLYFAIASLIVVALIIIIWMLSNNSQSLELATAVMNSVDNEMQLISVDDWITVTVIVLTI
jgi:hypothetical protein